MKAIATNPSNPAYGSVIKIKIIKSLQSTCRPSCKMIMLCIIKYMQCLQMQED